jgi:hypothetical protein
MPTSQGATLCAWPDCVDWGPGKSHPTGIALWIGVNRLMPQSGGYGPVAIVDPAPGLRGGRAGGRVLLVSEPRPPVHWAEHSDVAI